MGTTFSSFPGYAWSEHEWNGLDTTFEDGLYRNVKEDRNRKPNVNRIRKSGTNYLHLDMDDEPAGTEFPTEEDEVQKRSIRPSKSASKSKLPTLLSRSRYASNTAQESLSANNNEHEKSLDASVARGVLDASVPSRHKSDVSTSSSHEKPYLPESWPPRDMISDHLETLATLPTTLLLARFKPRHSKTFIEITYSTNNVTQETVFKSSEKVENLIPSKGETKVGDSEKEQMEHFFLIFKPCINLLQGQVWWNGYSLIFDQSSTKNRLKVSAYEMNPSQLLFELNNMTNVEILKSGHALEVKSIFDNGTSEEFKSFKIRGLIIKDLKVSKLRGTLITVHIPEFTAAALIVPNHAN